MDSLKESTDNYSDILGKVKRPMILAVFCFFGIFGLIWNFFKTLNPNDFESEMPFCVWALSSALISIATIIGVWKMKIWSIPLYFINNLIHQNFLLFYDRLHPIYFLGPMIWLIILYFHHKKMN